MNKLLLAIPAVCDLITSTLQYVALNFIPGSVYQMLRGGTIVTTFMFSIIFLRQKPLINQKIGSLLALGGVIVVGLANTLFTDTSSSGDSGGLQIVGYILIAGSLFSNGFLFVYEQKLLSKYHL